MSTPKRRKFESDDDVAPMSAFSLRRQLLAAKGTATTAVPSEPSSSASSPAPKIPVSVSAALPAGRRSARKQASSNAPSPQPSPSPGGREATAIAQESPAKKPGSGASLVTSDNGLPLAPVQQFSTFRPNKQNARKLAGAILQLRLSTSERFLVLGSFGIRVVSGEVTIAGATLNKTDNIVWAHAAHCHAIPVLRCSEDTKIELHPHPRAIELRRLERLSPMFRSLWNELAKPGTGAKSELASTFQIIGTAADAPKKAVIQDLVSHPAWNKKLAELVAKGGSKAPVVFLCGPKSSGKSTFGRILVNRLLTSPSQRAKRPAVAILDLDPGQPEFSPAGTMSLVHVKTPNLSPPFTHAVPETTDASVIRCHATASISPAADPEHYVECAQDLFHHYQQSALRNRPLIINTPGWILGTGLDLLTELISKLAPTDVIYMSEDGPTESVEGLRSATRTNFTTLPSQQTEFTSRTAAHLRSMQTMSYFHSIRASTGQVAWNPAPLTSVPPLQVQYAGENPGFLAILSYESQPPANLLAEAINGSVLALVGIEDGKALRFLPEVDFKGFGDVSVDRETTMDVDGKPVATATGPYVSRSPEGIPFISNPTSQTLDPRYSQTLGLVLLRGIDVAKKSLQLLTPISLHGIEESRKAGRQLVLVHGRFDTPGWAYTEDSYSRTYSETAVDEQETEITEEDTDNDDSEAEPEDLGMAGDVAETPWVEVLRGNEKRPVGSRVWRVRRDLGKGGPGGD
ncbi:hypothetical protein VDGD_00811 [Verticillium dahliae]|nr:hypothetical protein VdG1_05713 [Verticillium dahliae VDG1]RBQ98580.1 hypothetical protein VDGD_00811 [Verticillium dahliae]